MKINPSIFKSNDIRGVYPSELNKETAYKIGRAFVDCTNVKEVVVGCDGRLSSPVLFKELVRGIINQGADVYNIGRVPSEAVYFATAFYGYQSGIMITASHNPKEYGGFKMIRKEKNELVTVYRTNNIKEAVFRGEFKDIDKKGKVKRLDFWKDYINHIFSFVDPAKGGIKPFKVVIDASNGMAAEVIPKIKDKLPVEIIDLNFNIDGNFPAHPPNPLLEEATIEISQKIKDEKVDFGFIFDADADRIYLIDEKGQFVRADITFLFLAKYFLEKEPGVAIAYNAVCSKTVPQFIKKWGGKPIRTKVGFSFVQEGIFKNNGAVGGELSGHYCFKDNFFLDSGFIAFLILLKIISAGNKKVSEMVKELSIYAKSNEISFEVENKEKIIEKVKEKYSDGKQDFLDGLTVEYKYWWFNIRPSNTEPLLRLTIEADTEKILKQKKKELIGFINSIK